MSLWFCLDKHLLWHSSHWPGHLLQKLITLRGLKAFATGRPGLLIPALLSKRIPFTSQITKRRRYLAIFVDFIPPEHDEARPIEYLPFIIEEIASLVDSHSIFIFVPWLAFRVFPIANDDDLSIVVLVKVTNQVTYLE